MRWPRSRPCSPSPPRRPLRPSPSADSRRAARVLTAAPTLVGRPMLFSGRSPRRTTRRRRSSCGPADGAWHRVATARAGADGTFAAQLAGSRSPARSPLALSRRDAQAAQTGAAPLAPATVYAARPRPGTTSPVASAPAACACGGARSASPTAVCRAVRASRSPTAAARSRAPVVDRGPSVRGVAYDLTIAAAGGWASSARAAQRRRPAAAEQRTPIRPRPAGRAATAATSPAALAARGAAIAGSPTRPR